MTDHFPDASNMIADTLPEWPIHIAAQVWCEPENAKTQMDPDLCLGFARALVATAERVEREMVSQHTIKVVCDYNHVHLMLDEGKEWPDARDYLASNGWQITTEPYEYWLAYTQQTMVYALADIVNAAIRSLPTHKEPS